MFCFVGRNTNGIVLVNVKHEAGGSARVRGKKVPRENSSLKGGLYGRKYLNPFYGFFAY